MTSATKNLVIGVLLLSAGVATKLHITPARADFGNWDSNRLTDIVTALNKANEIAERQMRATEVLTAAVRDLKAKSCP